MTTKKNPHAVALGRKGGKAAARNASGKHLKAVSPEERQERARKAAGARWHGWIPKPGDIVTLKGDGDKTRTVQGTVERTSKAKCGPGVVLVYLLGYTDPFIAEDREIINHSR